ncbi:MAG: allantoinase AllB [Deltaproteobacteria bacterium HGW-Deltaproteobacteria-17]|nr:MAG: allantoinase AllB [Deltaproteobacteria bacterium HGW-Deltaproteobacteria-17]
MSDAAIRIASRRVVTGRGIRPAVVTAERGVLRSVEPLQDPPGQDILDVGDRVLMAGLVDSHVHVNEPGRTEWEGFASATRAAAAGGVTTIVDMPLNSVPATVDEAGLRAKLDAARGRCMVNYGVWGGVVPGNLAALDAMTRGERAVLGFKCFLSPSGVDEFGHVGTPDLRAAMREVARLDSVLLVHAEAPEIIEAAAGASGLSEHPRRYAAFLASRPIQAEVRAIALVADLAHETRCAVHIVHVSAAESLPVIEAARARGVRLSAETCPHYLGFAAEEIPDGATLFKCAPPIRDAANRERLWEGLRRGTLEMVATDHSPCPPAMKAPESGSFAAAWGGIASLQFGLSAVWTEARRRGFTIEDVTRWMCERPARLAGLAGRKGRIAPGYDADLVVWNPEDERVIDAGMIEHRHKATPWAGWRLAGVVEMTIVRGRVVYERGEFIGELAGEFVGGRRNG